MPSAPRIGIVLPAIALLCAASGSARADDSPFLPPAGDAWGGGASRKAESFELAGASVTSSGTQVCIYDVEAKRSRWISVGGSSDQIQVLSYDPEKDEVVIKANGLRQTLSLNKPVLGPSGPAGVAMPISGPIVALPTAVPPAPAAPMNLASPPATPKALEVARQEREARMLVSDLLEIGIQQRKAYEAAARKAATENK